MCDRQKGQLICDIGVTLYPSSEENLVGLWRLDKLEASYGAGGYLTGNLHTLNTLSHFGGLQAPMPEARRNRTHLIFRSSYNLAYEATRKHDNSRNLFDETKVFHRDPKFLAEINEVLKIYENKASFKSYGVRDEFRVLSSTLNVIGDCLASLVSSLLPFFFFFFSFWMLTTKTDNRTGRKQADDLVEGVDVVCILGPSSSWIGSTPPQNQLCQPA